MILNPKLPQGEVTKLALVNCQLIAGTTPGLKKSDNEDSLAISKDVESIRIFLADGHWGDKAAISHSQMTEHLESFPDSKAAAAQLVKSLEQDLYQSYYFPGIDENKDFTPETSLLGIEYRLEEKLLSIYNYGDCRLLIIRDNQIFFQLETQPTWLGVFSKLGLRQRQSVDDALLYKQIKLQTGDYVVAFSDGIDECIYQQPTISNETLVNIVTESKTNLIAFDKIMDKVFKYGAEDNASLVIFKV
jgi:serine/threonine protein phosphatase PrpC